MTKEKEQGSNRRWLVDLLKRPIEQATGIRPESYGSSLTRSDAFSRVRFFELSSISLDIHATQFWFDDAAIAPESLAYLSGHIHSSDLVIGYELSEQTRRLLDRVGVAWIDLWLHPVRFLDDVLFGFSSSNGAVYDAMRPFHVGEDTIQLYADRLRIQYYKGYKRPDLPIKPGSSLFIGQTLEDKAVCDNGRMVNLLDFKAAFERAGEQYGTVYYSRHPYVKKGDKAILDYVNNCGFAKVVDWPAYHALASGQLANVFSISSSVVYEARYFGLKTAFLFKPVLRYGFNRAAGEYLTIYQEFVSPHFWAQALAPLMPTKPCDRVMFLEQKDKLRDMLNFYWSYRHVDKQEDMRQTLVAVDRKLQSLLPKSAPAKAAPRPALVKPVAGRAWSEVQAEIEALMADAAVITFDVFDTLIERPFEDPNDLFDYLAPQARKLTGLLDLDYRKARLEARGLVSPGAHDEEVPLALRYQAMIEKLGLGPGIAKRLRALEEEAELRLCRPRKTGQALYEAALRLGRRVALVSDTFFDATFMAELLGKNGYTRHEATFLSSVEGKLKHSGNLYPVVLHRMGVAANQVLHIGDNVHADIKQAKAAGLHSYHLPRAVESFRQRSLLSDKYLGGSSVMRSVVRGLIANRLSDNPYGLPQPSYVGDTLGDFGYAIAGPIFAGFAKWVLEKALADNVDTLYFLARDGDIVKRCYEQLSRHYPNAPRAVYLRASRRGVNVPALYSEADVLALLEVNFTPTPLGKLLKNRFGLGDAPMALLQEAGYQSLQDLADFRKDAGRLKDLLRKLSPSILVNAAEEREDLLGYFRGNGLMGPGRKAVVDIGHNGTLQASIAKLIEDPSLGGYYFVTYREIEDRVTRLGMAASAYLAEAIDGADKRHVYCNYLLMFEALFLNTEGSFLRMRRDASGAWQADLLPTGMEAGRIQFIQQVHDAAEAFSKDLGQVLGSALEGARWDGNAAIAGYAALLKTPTLVEAQLFEGVAFENVYSGRDARLVIQRVPGDADATVAQSIWKEGAQALAAGMGEPERLRTRFVRELVRRAVSEKKYRKFLNSPREFFSDSRVPFLRPLAFFTSK